jgi:hypothetical protein
LGQGVTHPLKTHKLSLAKFVEFCCPLN